MSNALSKPTYTYKRFRVKRADGGSTTVSVDPALVVQACKVLGNFAEVSRVVREAAVAFVAGEPNAAKNRSAHVTRTLKALIEGKGAPATAPVEAATDVEVSDGASIEAVLTEEVPSVEGSGEGFADVAVDSAA